MQKKPIWLIANWKMNGDGARVQEYAYAVNAALREAPATLHTVFCPPTCYLTDAAQSLPQNARLMLGAQNVHGATHGAHTGEISAPMLKDIGCRYVIIGHSERRSVGETDTQVLEKAKAAQAAGLLPVICVGESLAAYDAGKTTQMLDGQLAALASLTPQTYLIAYEPIWAIGTGKTAKAEDIRCAHAHIKSTLGSETSVLYGGSVNVGNIGEILSLPEVAGALIGGASLEIESMRTLIAAAK